jgi:hypothetical protein
MIELRDEDWVRKGICGGHCRGALRSLRILCVCWNKGHSCFAIDITMDLSEEGFGDDDARTLIYVLFLQGKN